MRRQLARSKYNYSNAKDEMPCPPHPTYDNHHHCVPMIQHSDCQYYLDLDYDDYDDDDDFDDGFGDV